MGLALLSVISAVFPGILMGVVAGWKGGTVNKIISPALSR
jgi:ABC-type dipeptide/oligopeptide/nickel transport system permease subunit